MAAGGGRLARALLGAAMLAAGCAPADEAARPNVVLVVIDTLRTDHVSAYGYELPTMPNVDEIAARGVLFERCSAQSSWTMTSMISLMTGRPLFTPIYRVPETVPMLAESFAAAGYRTGAFVANSVLAADAGFTRGIETWDARAKLTRQWRADDVTDRALAFLERDDERPFFLWLHYLDPHAPYLPEPVWKRGPDEVFEPFERELVERVVAEAPPGERGWLGYQRDALARDVNRYDAELRHLDRRLGALADRLDALGLTDETYLVIASDHGETLYRRPEQRDRIATLREHRSAQGERMRLSDYVKQQHAGLPYEELLHVAWIVAGPGLPAGRRVPALVSNLDLMPTVLGLAGLPAPDGLAGRDLSQALRTGAPIAPANWVVASYEDIASARTPDGNKVVLVDPGTAEALGVPSAQAFALDEDPHELRPLPLEQDDEARALAERLRDAIANDPFAPFGGEGMDAETVARLREMGYLR